MREVTDAALQMLYWACRNQAGFPGQVPDESTGAVSTTNILKGLGLATPDQVLNPGPERATLKPSPAKAHRAESWSSTRVPRNVDVVKLSVLSEKRVGSPTVGDEKTLELPLSTGTNNDAKLDVEVQFRACSADLAPLAQGRHNENDPGTPQSITPSLIYPRGSHASLMLDDVSDLNFDLPSTSASNGSSDPASPVTPDPFLAPALCVQLRQSLSPSPACPYDIYLPAWHSSQASINSTWADQKRAESGVDETFNRS
jgi:hypothetical protein